MAAMCWEQHGGSVVHLRAFPRWVHRPVAVLSNVATELKPTPLRVQGSMDFSRTAAAVSAGLVAVSPTATTAFSTTSLGAGPASFAAEPGTHDDRKRQRQRLRRHL